MRHQIEKIHTKRIIGLVLIVIVIFLSGSMRLFNYQVVHGEEYLKSAQKSSFTTVKITAARGEIVDRNGIPFTKNKASFNVELDYAFLERGKENQVIYNLIKLFEELGESYIDNLPISKTRPYQFLPDREDDVARLKKNVDVNTYATAQNCMDNIFERNDYRYRKNSELKDISGVEYQSFSEDYKRKIAGVQYEMILKGFSSYNPRFTFAEDISPQTVVLLRELSGDFQGVEVVEKASRTYVGGEVASHLIGKTGLMNESQLEYYMNLEGSDYAMDDRVGQGGVEKAFESTLRGKNGEMKVIKNSRGDVVDVIETISPEAGKTVALTIDYEFNKKVNDIFAAYIKNYNETNKEKKVSEAGAIVVLDAKTGGLLATASFPYYNQEDFYLNYSSVAQAEGNPLFNRALNGLYRPGSTFKPVVAMGGLAEEIIAPTTKIYCGGVYHRASWNNTYNPTCLGTRHLGTSIDVVTALQWSCNIFFYDTGWNLNINRIAEYANLMGLGTETGLEINNSVGSISTPDKAERLGLTWNEGDIVQTAIGQSETEVTPLQMAIEAMTIANKGTRYNAHLLKAVYNHDMTELIEDEKTTVASSFNVSEEGLKSVVDGMIAAGATIGAPYQLTDLGYAVAVKTGTPQTTSADKTNNAFIAFAPAHDPQIAIACMLENSGNGTNKMVRQILEAYEPSKDFAQNE